MFKLNEHTTPKSIQQPFIGERDKIMAKNKSLQSISDYINYMTLIYFWKKLLKRP